ALGKPGASGALLMLPSVVSRAWIDPGHILICPAGAEERAASRGRISGKGTMTSNRLVLLLVTTGIALCTLISPVHAQTASGGKGVVLDKDGQPLPGATVTVSNPALGITSQGAVTDAKGEFRISPLPPGRGYKLTVAFQTMSTITLSDIEVTNGRLTSVPV